jgi:uncharacterized delta-60 repeat protein
MKLTKIGLLFANLFLAFAFYSNVRALPGDLDPTFDSDGKTLTTVANNSRGEDMVIQADGKIVVAGYSSVTTNDYDVALVRYNADGSLDSGFGIGGQVSVPESGEQLATSVAIQPDGKIVVVGFLFISNTSRLTTYRFNPDGTLDSTFGSGGKAVQNIVNSEGHGVVLQPDGKIVIAGGVSVFFTVFRLNANGALDTSFNSVGYNTLTGGNFAEGIALQNDGKIVAGGHRGSEPKGVWARFNSNGTVEGGGALISSDIEIDDVAIQTDGKIVFAGTQRRSLADIAVTRINADKTVDKNFGSFGVSRILFNGLNQAHSRGNTVVIEPGGRIVVGGALFDNGTSFFALARLNSNGFLDVGFGNGGKVKTEFGNPPPTTGLANEINSIALQADGKIVAAGLYRAPSNTYNIAVARYDGGGSGTLNNRTPFDFDGDGRADISVIRPATNVWYHYLSFTSSDSQRAFGTGGDVYAPADYDGDGRTDYAIYRPSTGWWWYQVSSGGGISTYNFGVEGGIPRPGDYDGDGRADFILYSPSTNVWHRRTSIEGNFPQTSNVTFGIAGDKPLIGDFDGDGKSDPAVFRPSNGNWWYLSSIDNSQRAVQWGIATDVPVPADYDGDRKTDFAVYRPSEGVWYIINSSNGAFTIAGFGLQADKPVPADYDGDGRADLAVYRDGVWWILRSSDNLSTAIQYGTASDIPLSVY